jgi:hypothetical protein
MGAQPYEAADARIRNLVIDRLLRMNARHATHAWLQRRARPVGPHGLAFLYADRVFPDQHAEVAAATRLVDDGDDVRDLPRLLYRLTTLARERYLPAGGFDPRATLANRTDPMSAAATYIGLGVSSLDTFEASWTQNQSAAVGPLDLPGRCFVLLTDGTMVLLERGGQDVFGEVQVQSTHELNVEPGIASRRWKRRADLHTMGGTGEIWRRLYDLHELAARMWLNPRSY